MSEPKKEKPEEGKEPERPAPEEKPLTLEELETKNQAMLETLGYKSKPKDEKKTEGAAVSAASSAETPAAGKAAATDGVAKEAGTPPEKPAGTEPEKSKRRKPYAERVAETISDKVKETLDSIKSPAEQPPQPSEDEPSPKDIRERKVLEVLAERPEYRDIVGQFDKFVPLEADYIAKWEKENPGVEFDPESDDHAEFYNKHEPEFDDDDFTDAKIELTKREAKEEWKAEQARDRLVNQAVEGIKQTQLAVVEELISEVDPALDAKTLSEVNAKDELLGEFMAYEVPHLQALATETELLLNSKLGYKFDEKNPMHMEWGKKLAEYEKDLVTYSEKDLKWQGRDFATIDEFAKLSPAEQQRVWTLLEGDRMKKLLVADFAGKLKAKLGKLRPKGREAASEASQTKPEQKPVTPASAADNRRSPSMPDAGDRVPANGISEKLPETAYNLLYPGKS